MNLLIEFMDSDRKAFLDIEDLEVFGDILSFYLPNPYYSDKRIFNLDYIYSFKIIMKGNENEN